MIFQCLGSLRVAQEVKHLHKVPRDLSNPCCMWALFPKPSNASPGCQELLQLQVSALESCAGFGGAVVQTHSWAGKACLCFFMCCWVWWMYFQWSSRLKKRKKKMKICVFDGLRHIFLWRKGMVEIVVVSHWYDFRHALKLLRAFQPLISSTKSSSFIPALLKASRFGLWWGMVCSRLILSSVFWWKNSCKMIQQIELECRVWFGMGRVDQVPEKKQKYVSDLLGLTLMNKKHKLNYKILPLLKPLSQTGFLAQSLWGFSITYKRERQRILCFLIENEQVLMRNVIC